MNMTGNCDGRRGLRSVKYMYHYLVDFCLIFFSLSKQHRTPYKYCQVSSFIYEY